MATSVLPVALILANNLGGLFLFVILGWTGHVVDHLADTVLQVLEPLTVIDVTILAVAIGAAALTDTISEVTIVDIPIGVGGNGLASLAARHRFSLSVLGLECVLGTCVFLVCHCLQLI